MKWNRINSKHTKIEIEAEITKENDVMNEVENAKWYQVIRKKRTWLLLLVPISLFLLWVVKNNAQIAEYVFARGVYKVLSQGLSLLTGMLPFSLMEAELLIVPILVVVIAIRFLWKLIKRKRRKQGGISYRLAEGILNAACTLSIVLFLFVILAGVNYYRYPFANYSGLDVQESTMEELYNLCLDLTVEAANIREQLQMEAGAEKNEVFQFHTSWREVASTAEKSFEKIADEYPVLAGHYASPKLVFFSRFMSRMEITGIFWPFTMEANVNIDASDYSVPAAMSHELAHLRGFMREDEANYIAYLVCKQSDSLEFQYSGIMLALSYASNQLYKQDAERYQQVLEHYNTAMLADLREEYYYWKQFEDTVISTASNAMNNNYLKANNQDDGVRSYGRMVDLLLAEYRKNQQSE